MPRVRSTSMMRVSPIAARITDEVAGWRKQGYHPFPSETTRQLLSHWFERDEEQGDRFHDCQRQAIETIIYLHEVRKVTNLRELYEQFGPEYLNLSDTVRKEADSVPFMKYCFKMATGSGKTWVLAATIVWQYFNALNKETTARFSSRFMVVTPGLEVRNRILDSFKGLRDPHTGRRDPMTSDYRRPVLMPDSPDWRGRFHLLEQVKEPDEIRPNSPPPDGPFVAITNWQQFVMPKDGSASLAEQIGIDMPDQPQAEVVADFMTEYPDLVILNDEAHHVHDKQTARGDDLVWRRFMQTLDRRMAERHGKTRSLFMQVDFSATPFYGSGDSKEFFPHIVYDYDLKSALNDMLVKQLFVEERTVSEGKLGLKSLDFRATRATADKGKRGEVLDLSTDQKHILSIGLAKLNQLTTDFVNKGLNRKPVLMILCEETEVADRVRDFYLTQEDHKGDKFDQRGVLLFHSNLEKDRHGYTLEQARGRGEADPARNYPTLDDIDDDQHPLQIVVSVLALREGFDKTNICVIGVLRATEADLLLEQIVGRGIRLMFPDHKSPESIREAKRQAVEQLKNHEKPNNSLDFLYIVEHPRFKDFYDSLRRQGYLIAGGDSRQITPAGDIISVPFDPARVPRRDIAWPIAVQDETKEPDLAQIKGSELPAPPLPTFEIFRKNYAAQSITDRHLDTGTKADTWALRDKWFDYSHFLRKIADDIAKAGKNPWITSRRAEIAAIVDDYTSHRLFKDTVDFTQPENYKVLADPSIQSHVINAVRGALHELLDQPRFEIKKGQWRRLAQLDHIHARSDHCLPNKKCIYPRVGYPARSGGFERDVMDELLDKSTEVLAWCKLMRKHGLTVAYRDPTGLQRTYEIDFVVRTADRCYVLETKGNDALVHPVVGLKANAAKTWAESICGVRPDGPGWPTQPDQWEYLLLSESLYYANEGASFSALLPAMRSLRDQTIAQHFHGTLFAR